MTNLKEIALYVAQSMDPDERYFPYRNDLPEFLERCLAELSKDAAPVGTVNIGKGIFDVEWHRDFDIGIHILYTHPAPRNEEVEAQSGEPVAWMKALFDAHDTAMHHALAARIPECGTFGEIAQNLDYVLQEILR